MSFQKVIFGIICLTITFENAVSRNLVCYYGSWAAGHEGLGKYEISDIDPNLCTHVIYAFIGVNTNGTIKINDPDKEVTGGNFKKFSNLRKKNRSLKTLIAVGGGAEGVVGFSTVASDPTLRTKFVRELYKFIRQYKFSGLDVDWEFPGVGEGSRPEDKANFILLLKELRAKLSRKKYLLTAAVNPNLWLVDQAYDIPQISKYLDIINMMTYDYHGDWETVTGHNSPLYPTSTEADKNLNIDVTIKYWLSHGADRSKMVLGFGMYGRSFTLADPNNATLGAPVTGPGTAGPYIMSPGILAYSEMCELRTWKRTVDPEQKVPYKSNGDQWVGYDNRKSVALKCKYLISKRLGGAMVWSIDQDDFSGHCKMGRYPLISTIKSYM